MIVVGVDSSRAALEAAAWAAREAGLRDVPLLVAHAMPRWAYEGGTDRYAEVAAWMRDGGRAVLAAAEERVRLERPGISVTTTFLPDDPRTALIDAAKDADLLVVGSHGIGGFRGMLVGSVAYGVAGHAACDVVVVREAPPSSCPEIVAGVDGSPASGRVLEFALTEARLRGARLRVVTVIPEGFPPAETDEPHPADATLAERHPDVPVIEEIAHGHPVEVLRQAADGADLLVVGSHGHRAFAGMLLGSVSHELLHHAPCPLAVVRNAG
ncbi:universal stress protein [Nonomuraea rhodomycinica]|uniref:Universal stress protein n=1 Tax=Nonomuraea rhodomycinica TaxID=1712872 RepID=A0A7Y6MAB1_9ACTN|nr:universal stress protein [Nonomuraea rhodomycinica]NUW39496.1 universal stress protein [Nonomuraea rhodomycinica]